MNGCYLLCSFAGQVCTGSPSVFVSLLTIGNLDIGHSDPHKDLQYIWMDGDGRMCGSVRRSCDDHLVCSVRALAWLFALPDVVRVRRGPHEMLWIGWRGGAQLLKREKLTDMSPHAVTEFGRAREKDSVVGPGMDLNDAERGRAREGIEGQHAPVKSDVVVDGNVSDGNR